jgi:hypothetical protein
VGINELNQIFRDLGTIVQEQGGNIGRFEALSKLPVSSTQSQSSTIL